MSKKTTTPATSTPAAAATTSGVVFTDQTLRTAAGLAADGYRPVWVGRSGEQSSGASVARHLQAAIALLDQDGWIGTHSCTTDTDGLEVPDDDSMTVKAMLKTLLRLVRDEFGGGDKRRTLSSALRHVGEEGVHGDSDTAYVADAVLDLIIRAHTGAETAYAAVWSERVGRTHADVTALLRAGAEFARTYGPSAHGTQAQAA